jgi:hypothetical protein
MNEYMSRILHERNLGGHRKGKEREKETSLMSPYPPEHH